MPNSNQVHEWIASGLECDHLEVHGPDEVHFQALVVSAMFEGKTVVQRHQLIYKALGDKMHNEVHALSIKALTPSEWQQ